MGVSPHAPPRPMRRQGVAEGRRCTGALPALPSVAGLATLCSVPGRPDPAAVPAARLTTARLVLEPLAVEHAGEMLDVLADPASYTVIGGGPPTLDELTARYARQVAGPRRDGEAWRIWVIRLDGRAVGYVQATLVVQEVR